MKNNKTLAFCHIIKASGTTFSDVLRKNHGIRHLDAIPPRNCYVYGRREIERDFKLFPKLNSIAGHGLRPYVDYGSVTDKLQWVTWLRDPQKRLISGYQHSIEKGGREVDFETWLQEPNHRNRQVFFLTGNEDDLDGAKKKIEELDIFVGFVERFDESLVLLKKLLLNDSFDIDYSKPSNQAKKGMVAKEIHNNIERYRDLIDHSIGLDQELYNWAMQRHMKLLQEQYNKVNLSDEINFTILHGQDSLLQRLNRIGNKAIRNIFYKPIISKN